MRIFSPMFAAKFVSAPIAFIQVYGYVHRVTVFVCHGTTGRCVRTRRRTIFPCCPTLCTAFATKMTSMKYPALRGFAGIHAFLFCKVPPITLFYLSCLFCRSLSRCAHKCLSEVAIFGVLRIVFLAAYYFYGVAIGYINVYFAPLNRFYKRTFFW